MDIPPLYKSAAGKHAVMNDYNRILATWAVPYQTQTVNTRYGETFMIVSGDSTNPPMILLHGVSSNSAIWADDIALYASHFRVYAVDIIGEPGKSAITRPSYTGLDFVEWLDDICQALNIPQVILVGLSQGSWIALKYASIYPEKVKALVLLAAGGITPYNEGFFERVRPLLRLGMWGHRRVLKIMFADIPVPNETVISTRLIMQHFITREDELPIVQDEELAKLTMPVLMIGGEKDILMNQQTIAQRLSNHVPQLEVEIIPGGGHVVMHTAPQVMGFLSRLQNT